jgi:C4-dicarboxylate-specific signal transduction histidine kinase
MVTSAEAGLRFLDRATPNLEKAKEAFKRIVADGHRAGAVLQAIRTTFRTEASGRTSLDIDELIEKAISVHRDDLQKHRIVMRAERNRQRPHVRGNGLQLQQVLLNLIANAIDAMKSSDEPRVLCVKSETSETDKVVFSVADTGRGVRAEHVDRLFTPLWTTKLDGMGMGLAICRAIIEAHGGRLSYTPNTPRGAVFQFTLQAA